MMSMFLKGCHVFIVEDNMQNRVVFQMALARYGASVSFERNGRETLQRLHAVTQTTPKIDAIVLDLMLADGVSGFDVFDQIRALPVYAATPIVAVSALDPAVALPQAREKGFAGFIAKPIENYRFAAQMAAIINGEQVWFTGDGGV